MDQEGSAGLSLQGSEVSGGGYHPDIDGGAPFRGTWRDRHDLAMRTYPHQSRTNSIPDSPLGKAGGRLRTSEFPPGFAESIGITRKTRLPG